VNGPDGTFYNLKRLHVAFALAAAATLATTVWMALADRCRPWKEHQRTYRAQIEPAVADKVAAADDWELLVPRGGPRRSPAIEQVWLPDLTIDYHFRAVPRCDRCVTCHLGIEEGGPARPIETEVRGKLPQPYRAHLRLDLFLGATSPHPTSEFGCTICHDGQGSATEFGFASHTPNDPQQAQQWQAEHGWRRNPHWDLPMLPARFAQARCLKCHRDVTDLEPTPRFPDPPAEKLLAGYHLVRRHGCFGCHEISGFAADGRQIGPDLRLASSAASPPADGTPPGTLRKVGPNLRDLSDRLDAATLADRIADPARFLPTSRMPRLFGLHEHLSGPTLAAAQAAESDEVRGVVEYLTEKGQPAELPDATLAWAVADARSGQRLFAEKGCLACHAHAAFPDLQATQGPELSRVGLKYTGPRAKAWLLAWLHDPQRLAPQTLMPAPQLDALAFSPPPADASMEGWLPFDPAADLAAFLLASTGAPPGELRSAAEGATTSLRSVPGLSTRAAYGTAGKPAVAPAWRPNPLPATALGREQLVELGRQTIARRGCYGCHEIAGFEKEPLIGPALHDWGRKAESLLAFERVAEFAAAQPSAGDDDGFYAAAIRAGRRAGFAWQKLLAPRSFDYQLAERKPPGEWLRMGRFRFTPAEREAIVTFLLGLVAEPPAEKYLPRPSPPRQAIIAGRKVLDQYACDTCHTLAMERWTLMIPGMRWPAPAATAEYDFARPQLSAEQLAASTVCDRRGRVRVEVVGMPRVDAAGRPVEDEDDDGRPICFFTLWEPAAITGRIWPVGGRELTVPQESILRRRPAWGGAFARWLYPRALAEARTAGATAAEIEAWGWVPPPLLRAGAAAQPAWLHAFLMQPQPIRPAAVLRMPRFGLSSAEATALASYLAAAAGSDYPFAPPVARPLAALPDRQRRLDLARKLVHDRTTFCAKCHVIGDRQPGGQARTVLAPDLATVGQRRRPDYLRRWLANPRAVLPYTAMPVNFPPAGPPLGQDLFPGTSREQLDAVWELLLDYQQTSTLP
jgi:cbb3-type cytochrome oxidase cytochrome c subunit